jgi:hypothetical protein
MSIAFSFFLRLFICFAGAKFLLQAIGADSRSYLIALTLIFLGNVYLFSYLIFKDRTKASPPAEEAAAPSAAAAAPEAKADPEKEPPPES